MRRTTVSATIFLLSYCCLYAQSWQSLGVSNDLESPNVLLVDSVNDVMYAVQNDYHVPNIISVLVWDGAAWVDTLVNGIYESHIYTLALYNGSLLAGGFFSLIDSDGYYLPVCYLMKWDGVRWIPFKNSIFNSPVHCILTNDSSFYALGTFDSLNHVFYNGIARWDGFAWQQVGYFPLGPPWYDSNWLFNGVFFNQSLYVGGNISDTSQNIQRIFRYNGTQWENVGDGIHGTFAGVWDFSIYHDNLMVGGSFTIADGGNTGNYIQSWNDTSWSEVGTGMAGINMVGNGTITKLFQYHDNLYAVGVFQYAGSVPAQYIAKWDGFQWCGLGSTFDNIVTTGAVFHDEIYIAGGFYSIDGDSIRFLAKWIGGNYVDTCSAPVGISQSTPNDFMFLLFPNPTSDEFTVTTSEKGQLKILNEPGQVIQTISICNKHQTISTEGIPSGTYLLSFQTDKTIQTKKIIIQH